MGGYATLLQLICEQIDVGIATASSLLLFDIGAAGRQTVAFFPIRMWRQANGSAMAQVRYRQTTAL
jgi:hypothetical protein